MAPSEFPEANLEFRENDIMVIWKMFAKIVYMNKYEPKNMNFKIWTQLLPVKYC